MCKTRGFNDNMASLAAERGEPGWENRGTGGAGEVARGVDPGTGVLVGSAIVKESVGRGLGVYKCRRAGCRNIGGSQSSVVGQRLSDSVRRGEVR